MKKIALLLCGALIALGASAETFQFKLTKAVTGVIVKGSTEVDLLYSATAPGQVSYSANYKTAPLRITSDSQGRVVIEEMQRITTPIKVTIYHNSTNITDLTVNGSGEIDAPSIMFSDEAKFTVNGSGEIDVDDVSSPEGTLSALVNGSGDVKVKRVSAANLSLLVNGSGEVEFDGGFTQTLTARNSGSGEVKSDVRVQGASKVALNGSGEVEVRSSSPMEISANGSGKVKVKGKRPQGVKINGDASRVKFK